jgi:hypothetical protein
VIENGREVLTSAARVVNEPPGFGRFRSLRHGFDEGAEFRQALFIPSLAEERDAQIELRDEQRTVRRERGAERRFGFPHVLVVRLLGQPEDRQPALILDASEQLLILARVLYGVLAVVRGLIEDAHRVVRARHAEMRFC